ncbi:hypothetical protein Hypma_011727 [Hypsizygus marmoreus]|uniref:Uncharacterized protein n=1 Tax=Hypsizygus marmoreus TaxID=39966 RepID=A0A369JM47_HYPMA|nr:hypothetical protein Hypma_011727 [Hypsizygus marmoreus]
MKEKWLREQVGLKWAIRPQASVKGTDEPLRSVELGNVEPQYDRRKKKTEKDSKCRRVKV